MKRSREKKKGKIKANQVNQMDRLRDSKMRRGMRVWKRGEENKFEKGGGDGRGRED